MRTNEWKSVDYENLEVGQRNLLSEVVEKECWTRQINQEDAVDSNKLRKLKILNNTKSEWMKVFVWYWLTDVVLDKGH